MERIKKKPVMGSFAPQGNSPVTNVTAFMAYTDAYLRQRDDVKKDQTILVRQLDPGPNGLPIEVYIFAGTTEWEKYEAIQASIFDHLLATVQEFGLRVFQNPTGADFSSFAKGQSAG
jgi:miniconductance mechanosensitive channel